MAVWSGSVRSAGRRATDRATNGGRLRPAQYPKRQMLQVLLLAAVSSGLFWIIWIYGNSLRDPRYFDGWILAVGFGVQLSFHIAIKSARLSPKSATRWRKVHIFLGYFLIAAFVSHSDFTLPDTGFEWALWACFVFVTLSGIFGIYLAWTLKVKRGIDQRVNEDRIAIRYTELAQEVKSMVATTDPAVVAIMLPAPPQDAWINDLYANHLRDFFQGPRNATAHLIGSHRPLLKLTDEIDTLSRYVDNQSREKLEAIKALIVEKDQLDFARVHLALTKGWLFVHVPVTYSLIALTVLHVIVVYAFSSGDW